MAIGRKDDNKPDGAIYDENENLRQDAGEQLKDEYDSADAYEKDRIELRGIIFFALGLIVLIGVTFVLMYALQVGMEAQAKSEDKVSPMALSQQEIREGKNLPPEPRLQSAPGFGVQPESGEWVNLELREPQSEYRILLKDWEKTWKEGRRDPHTGAVITLPIEEAKQRVLQQGIGQVRPPDQGQKAMQELQQYPSYQSSGRAMQYR